MSKDIIVIYNEFKNRKGTILVSLAIIFSILFISLLYYFYDDSYSIVTITTLILIFNITSYLFFILFSTKYEISDDKLIYRSGIIRGFISIFEIKKIIIGKTLWSGNRPATAIKGIIIKYNKYDEIYLSPKSNYELIEALLVVNSKIEIEDLT